MRRRLDPHSEHSMIWIKQHFHQQASVSIERGAMYKHYEKFCHCQGKVQINTAQFGKLVRCVFPSVQTRRLGKRGESKYHYLGIAAVAGPNGLTFGANQICTAVTDIRKRKPKVANARADVHAPLPAQLLPPAPEDDHEPQAVPPQDASFAPQPEAIRPAGRAPQGQIGMATVQHQQHQQHQLQHQHQHQHQQREQVQRQEQGWLEREQQQRRRKLQRRRQREHATGVASLAHPPQQQKTDFVWNIQPFVVFLDGCCPRCVTLEGLLKANDVRWVQRVEVGSADARVAGHTSFPYAYRVTKENALVMDTDPFWYSMLAGNLMAQNTQTSGSGSSNHAARPRPRPQLMAAAAAVPCVSLGAMSATTLAAATALRAAAGPNTAVTAARVVVAPITADGRLHVPLPLPCTGPKDCATKIESVEDAAPAKRPKLG